MNLLYYKDRIMIFAIDAKHSCVITDINGKKKYETDENIILSIHFGEFEMDSTHPMFFTELASIKSVLNMFIHGKMGSMRKSKPGSGKDFRIGDEKRGSLIFSKITKNDEHLLVIDHEIPKYEERRENYPWNYVGETFHFDHHDALVLETSISKAISIFRIDNINPEILASYKIGIYEFIWFVMNKIEKPYS